MPSHCPSTLVVENLKQIFAEYGIPKVVSDNGPHYDSYAFKKFAQEWNFRHQTSSPRYPKSNGFIESMVKSMKKTMRKASKSGQDINLALLCLRATPVDHKLPSPGEILRGNKLSTPLPTKILNNRKDTEEIRNRLAIRQDTMKEYHDRKARPLKPLEKGQHIRFQLQPQGAWIPGKVVEKAEEPRSYVLETPNGMKLRRNRIHIRDAPSPSVTFNISDDNEVETPEDDNVQAIGEPSSTQDTTIVQPPLVTQDNKEAPYRSRYGRVVKRNSRYQD